MKNCFNIQQIDQHSFLRNAISKTNYQLVQTHYITMQILLCDSIPYNFDAQPIDSYSSSEGQQAQSLISLNTRTDSSQVLVDIKTSIFMMIQSTSTNLSHCTAYAGDRYLCGISAPQRSLPWAPPFHFIWGLRGCMILKSSCQICIMIFQKNVPARG